MASKQSTKQCLWPCHKRESVDLSLEITLQAELVARVSHLVREQNYNV